MNLSQVFILCISFIISQTNFGNILFKSLDFFCTELYTKRLCFNHMTQIISSWELFSFFSDLGELYRKWRQQKRQI